MLDPSPTSPLTDAFLDRLVEGGLSPAELRAALDRLEHQPDGWRRCTLAFLEAQSWRESFRAIDDAAPAVVGAVASSRQASPQGPARHRSRSRQLAVAAGIAAISFLAGWRTQTGSNGGRLPERPPALVDRGHPARIPSPGPADPMRTIAVREPEESEVSSTSAAAGVAGPLRGGPTNWTPVAAIAAAPRAAERFAMSPLAPITEHQQALLEQQGYRVDRRRRLITATLRDGRRVTVPVDQIQLRYTGMESL